METKTKETKTGHTLPVTQEERNEMKAMIEKVKKTHKRKYLIELYMKGSGREFFSFETYHEAKNFICMMISDEACDACGFVSRRPM